MKRQTLPMPRGEKLYSSSSGQRVSENYEQQEARPGSWESLRSFTTLVNLERPGTACSKLRDFLILTRLLPGIKCKCRAQRRDQNQELGIPGPESCDKGGGGKQSPINGTTTWDATVMSS